MNNHLITVGSDSSVGLWRSPTLKEVDNQEPGLQDPQNYLLGRFRKSGDLGHFLTPTSACWLPNQSYFGVSYAEARIVLFDCETGKQV